MTNMRASRSPEVLKGRLFDRTAWRYFAAFFAGRWLRLSLLMVASTLLSLLIIPILLLVKRAFDVAIPAGDVKLLCLCGAGILLLRLFSSGVALSVRRAHLKIIRSVVTSIRESLLRKLYTLSRQTYTELDRERLHAQIVQDSHRIFEMTNSLLATIVPAVMTGVVLLVVMVVLNPLLMLILLALLPVLALASGASSRAAKRSVRVFQRAFEQFSKGMMFVLRHLELTKIQSSQTREIARQLGRLDELGTASSDMAYRFAVHSQVQTTLTGLGIVLILVIGGSSVALGHMTLGDFFSFYVAAGLLNSAFNQAFSGLPQLITGNESLQTLRRFDATDGAEPYSGTRKIDFHGAVRLQSASFSYGREGVIVDISLDIEPGRITALIGPNGSGKSTIAHLVLGLYRPTSGMLYADNVPYTELDLIHLRKSIGVVPQHPAIFSGSILENLTYGAEDLDRNEAIAAAKTALLHDFVGTLPDGYDTLVGGEGVLLSGGQCQRLAVARALLRQPSLLIMDEPTNHLDADTVRQLLGNVRTMAHDLSILLISHDPVVISSADRVYQLKAGTLVEQPDTVANG
jgi:ATP-binding cassette, subfamily B, bacterial